MALGSALSALVGGMANKRTPSATESALGVMQDLQRMEAQEQALGEQRATLEARKLLLGAQSEQAQLEVERLKSMGGDELRAAQDLEMREREAKITLDLAKADNLRQSSTLDATKAVSDQDNKDRELELREESNQTERLRVDKQPGVFERGVTEMGKRMFSAFDKVAAHSARYQELRAKQAYDASQQSRADKVTALSSGLRSESASADQYLSSVRTYLKRAVGEDKTEQVISLFLADQLGVESEDSAAISSALTQQEQQELAELRDGWETAMSRKQFYQSELERFTNIELPTPPAASTKHRDALEKGATDPTRGAAPVVPSASELRKTLLGK